MWWTNINYHKVVKSKEDDSWFSKLFTNKKLNTIKHTFIALNLLPILPNKIYLVVGCEILKWDDSIQFIFYYPSKWHLSQCASVAWVVLLQLWELTKHQAFNRILCGAAFSHVLVWRGVLMCVCHDNEVRPREACISDWVVAAGVSATTLIHHSDDSYFCLSFFFFLLLYHNPSLHLSVSFCISRVCICVCML